MMQAEQSLGSQMWRTLRTLGVAFLIISGVGVLMEDKGLGRGILNNPDMKPQMDMKTTLADVKGVDEAKVSSANLQQPFAFGALASALVHGYQWQWTLCSLMPVTDEAITSTCYTRLLPDIIILPLSTIEFA